MKTVFAKDRPLQRGTVGAPRRADNPSREKTREGNGLSCDQRMAEDCPQFCAHHQTLPSVTECRRIGGNPCCASICGTPSQFVALRERYNERAAWAGVQQRCTRYHERITRASQERNFRATSRGAVQHTIGSRAQSGEPGSLPPNCFAL
jgi:hypothetical protein